MANRWWRRGDRRSLRRRRCLQLAGGVLASAGTLGAATAGRDAGTGKPGANGRASIDRSAYDDVIDVVEAGADDTGDRSVTAVIQSLVDDDTLLEFPPGTYLFDGEVRFTDFRNVGIVGTDATLVPASGTSFRADGTPIVFKLGTHYAPGRNLAIENLTFDFRRDDTGVRGIQAQVADGLSVRNVEFVGTHDSGSRGPLCFDVVNPNGSGTVENVRMPDGGVHADHTPQNFLVAGIGPAAITTSHRHTGSITYRNLEIGGFPDNGLYAYTPNGHVGVEDSAFYNSNVANVRIAGTGSYVRDCSFVVDENRDGFGAQRAIRLDAGADLEVRNVDVELDADLTDAIRVLDDVDSATIDDVTLELTPRVRDGVAVTAGASDVNVETLRANGHRRYDVFRY